MKTVTYSCDVAIVGGGLAGLTLSAILGQAGLRVIVLDQTDVNAHYTGDERTTAISYGSELILQHAGVWPYLENLGAAIRDIKILDGNSPVLLQFQSHEVENKNFGTIVLNADLRRALHRKVSALDSVEILSPEAVKDFEVSDTHAVLNTQNGVSITAKAIIGADGRCSTTRDWMEIDCRRKDYKQTAVVCIAYHENPHNNAAIEHFWPGGPFAILPMADDADGRHRSSVVFTEHRRAGRPSLMDLDAPAFGRVLQARFPRSYGTVEICTERTAYPLKLAHAMHYIAPRMALVADAAHGIHPIAGQGLNLGFRDVKEIAALMITAHKQGADIGHIDVLETYQRRRRPDNLAMVAFTDGLVHLFSNKNPALKLVRRMGLRAVSKLPAAKQFFMRQAMADQQSHRQEPLEDV